MNQLQTLEEPQDRLVEGDVSRPRTAGRFGPSLMEQLVNSVLDHKWVLLLIVIICMVIGLVATLFMTPLYTATASIEISRKQENVTNVEGVTPESQGVDLEFYETQYSLLGARSLAERVARARNLANNDEFFETFGVDPDALEGSGDSAAGGTMTAARRSERLQIATDILLENVSISPLRGSSLVDVRFTSPQPRLSSDIANTWVEQFIQANLDRRFSSTQDARDYLEDRLAQLRERLEQSEQQLVAYASQNEIVTLSETRDSEGRTSGQQTLVGNDLQAMNQALAQARADRIAAEAALARSGGARDSLNNAAINAMRQNRAEIASQRANLLTQFEPGYPAVEALTSQLAELDRSIAAEESRVRGTSRASYEEALQRENQLQATVDQLKGRFINQNRDSIQYNIYQREVDTNRQLYDALLQRYKEIGVAGVGSNNIAIIDRAMVPEEPSQPNMAVNLLIAMLLGLGLAAVYLFIREQIDQTVRDPAQVRDALDLSLLGTVPDVPRSDILEDLGDPKSVVFEAYFSIGTTLSFLTEHGVPRSMMFTSTQPNEGKSTSAHALAIVLARIGRKVLLIDGDLRNPSLHAMQDIDNDSGLSNLLAGDGSVLQAARPSVYPNLSFIPAGPIPPNPAELLTGNRLPNLIADASSEFDTVLIDGPPVLGIADATLLARNVEGIIYAIEANGAKLRAIQGALDRLQGSNGHIFGAIVTKFESRDRGYGYGYGYGYGADPASQGS